MAEMKELRWGMIGCGMISSDFIRALSYCENNHKVVAVAASSSAEKAAEFHKKLGLGADTQIYGSYQELIDDPNVDIVYVGNLNNTHLEWVLKALDGNKHVLCEKPMGVNVKEVQKMVDKAREKRKFLMEAVWSRFFPAWRYLREVIDSKKYGEVKLSSANFATGLHNNRFDIEKGETVLLDIGVYCVTFSLFVFNNKEPKEIYTFAGKNEDDVDVWGNVTLDYGDGSQAIFYYNGTLDGMTNAVVFFDEGVIQIPRMFWCPTQLQEISNPVTEGFAEPKIHEFPLNEEKDKENFNYNHSSGFRYEADHVFECIQQGKTESDIMSLDESLRFHKLVEKIRHKLGVFLKQDNA